MRTPWWVVNEADVVSTVMERGRVVGGSEEASTGDSMGNGWSRAVFYSSCSDPADRTRDKALGAAIVVDPLKLASGDRSGRLGGPPVNKVASVPTRWALKQDCSFGTSPVQHHDWLSSARGRFYELQHTSRISLSRRSPPSHCTQILLCPSAFHCWPSLEAPSNLKAPPFPPVFLGSTLAILSPYKSLYL